MTYLNKNLYRKIPKQLRKAREKLLIPRVNEPSFCFGFDVGFATC